MLTLLDIPDLGGGGGGTACCAANTLPPGAPPPYALADPGVGVGGKCEYKLGVLGADGVPLPFANAGLYGEPTVAAVGKPEPGVCGESSDDERCGGGMRGLAGFGLSPRPYDALLGVPAEPSAGFGEPGNDGVYGLALGRGLPAKVPDTGVPA